jgi:hypothetical protein
MNNTSVGLLPTVVLVAGSAFLLPACGTVGDTGAVKQANELAIACKTDEALAAAERASRGGGLGANIGDLQRVVILRDAGRTSEAAAAMAERNQRAGADAKAAAEAEQAVGKSLEELRAECHKRTGRRTCP